MNIRLEQPRDFREVENLTREAFWNVYRPGCTEHFVLNRYRKNPDFMPELDFVMEEDDRIIGHVMFSKASITQENGSVWPAWTFGPISILPAYKRKGYGLKLLQYAIGKAREAGVGVLCMEGNIDFYRHAGFVLASSLKIHYHGEPKESEVPYFLAQELIPGYLQGIEGTYHTPKGYYVADEYPEDFAHYESTFPSKIKKLQSGQLPQFCQSCCMPLTKEEDCGRCSDGNICFDYCKYCYDGGRFLHDYTMEEMIAHCSQFAGTFEPPISKEAYILQMRHIFPQLKRWRNPNVDGSDTQSVSGFLSAAQVADIEQLIDTLPVAYISSVDGEGFPWTKAMLSPRKRDGIKVFYFTTNTSSLRVAQYEANSKASLYFCDERGFRGVMLRGRMEVLTDAASKELIWREGDTEYYPGGLTDPDYCVLRFTAIDGRFYSDYNPRSFTV